MSAGPSIGQTLGHYRVLQQIGKGGMGVVFRAHDDRLERDVALKVLPPGTVDDAARKRFRREALTLSQLNHPNIAIVHDFDSCDGVDFLVMELIPGESLDETLTGRPLTEQTICGVGAQMAEGLAAAHAAGVVHRDLKPGNLRVCPDGRLKILDFGLAKPIKPSDALTATFTEARGVVGTWPYMAPEQLRAEPLDQRTDLHAAGAVLYEMATGRRPFTDTQSARLIDAILNRPPAPPRSLNPAISAEMERIILKCLEKHPDNRYQSAQELAVDLRRLAGTMAMPAVAAPPRAKPRSGWPMAAIAVAGCLLGAATVTVWWRGRTGPASSAPRVQALAVLPLENLSGDPQQEFFADGMTDELITDLGTIEQLRVISRTSVMAYKGRHPPLTEIARALNVDAVVEGTVVRAKNRVRITVRLIELPGERVLWQKQSEERDMRDVLALQEEVARDIANEIQIKLSAQQQARLAGSRHVDPEAYEQYLRGRQETGKPFSEHDVEYFEKALQIDPHYAAAYAGLAEAYANHSFGLSPPSEVLPKAREAARKALELDDTLAEAHGSMGWVKLAYDWDWAGAEAEFRKAIALNPGGMLGHYYLSFLLSGVRRHEDALVEARRALALDPLALATNANLGWRYQSAQRFDEAIEQYRTTLRLQPAARWVQVDISECYICKGMPREALAEIGSERQDLAVMMYAGVVEASLGKKAEARKKIEWLMEMRKQRYTPASTVAMIYEALGDRDQAFAWLETAYREHDSWLINFGWPCGHSTLRGDPRYQDLERRLHLSTQPAS